MEAQSCVSRTNDRSLSLALQLKACQDSSMGPNFIFLGGQKYGYRPLPYSISCAEYDMIYKALVDFERDYSVLDEW